MGSHRNREPHARNHMNSRRSMNRRERLSSMLRPEFMGRSCATSAIPQSRLGPMNWVRKHFAAPATGFWFITEFRGPSPQAPEGQHLNSSGWNPEKRPVLVLDPEGVSPKGLRTVRPYQGREATRPPRPWVAPTAIQVASLRDEQRPCDSRRAPEFGEEPKFWTGRGHGSREGCRFEPV